MAGAAAQWEVLKDEATCSICLDYFSDPVSIECGHAFCRPCIAQLWQDFCTDFRCPQCRLHTTSKTLRPMRQLSTMVEIARQLQTQSASPREEEMCPEHREQLKLFCKTDHKPICVICRESSAHRPHSVVPVGEAVEKYKDRFEGYINIRKRKLEEIVELQSKEEEKVTEMKCKFHCQRELIMSEFEKLQKVMEEEKCCCLSSLSDKEKRTIKKMNLKIVPFEQQQSALRTEIAEIASTCQQSDVVLLKNVNSITSRYSEMKYKNPDPYIFGSAEESRKNCPSFNKIQFDLQKGILEPVEWRWARSFAADMTFDLDTASPWLIISEDGRGLRLRDKETNPPNTLETCDYSASALGKARLSSGRHYWEVEVEGMTAWDIGVCDESVARKCRPTPSPRRGYWIVRYRYLRFVALTSPQTPLSPSVYPRVVALFLDYEAGRLSVYNKHDRSLLFTFPLASFPHTLRPYFSPCLCPVGTLRILQVTEE